MDPGVPGARRDDSTCGWGEFDAVQILEPFNKGGRQPTSSDNQVVGWLSNGTETRKAFVIVSNDWATIYPSMDLHRKEEKRY